MNRFLACFPFFKRSEHQRNSGPTFYVHGTENNVEEPVSFYQRAAVVPIPCPSAPAIIKRAALVRPMVQDTDIQTPWTHRDVESLAPEKDGQTSPPDLLSTSAIPNIAGCSKNDDVGTSTGFEGNVITQLYYPYPEGNVLFTGPIDEGCRINRILKMADSVIRRRTKNRVVVLTDEERAARGIH